MSGVVLPAGVAVAVPESDGLEWRDCAAIDPSTGIRCAELPVPADWRRSAGQRIMIGTANAGHAAYLSGNRCVRDVAHRYLITGQTPEAGHRCRAGR